MNRKPLTETIICPECRNEAYDPQCICRGARAIVRVVSCGCCSANHRSEDCPYFCRECNRHHEIGDHAS